MFNYRYDDPANYAPEEDQYRRQINPYNQSVGYCGPEYDDPANCAPEEDQYGSQYGGRKLFNEIFRIYTSDFVKFHKLVKNLVFLTEILNLN